MMLGRYAQPTTIERTTGLTSEEITNLHIDECEKLMIERGKLKKPNKLWTWLQGKYKKFGEKTGLLKKEPYLYTELD